MSHPYSTGFEHEWQAFQSVPSGDQLVTLAELVASVTNEASPDFMGLFAGMSTRYEVNADLILSVFVLIPEVDGFAPATNEYRISQECEITRQEHYGV